MLASGGDALPHAPKAPDAISAIIKTPINRRNLNSEGTWIRSNPAIPQNPFFGADEVIRIRWKNLGLDTKMHRLLRTTRMPKRILR